MNALTQPYCLVFKCSGSDLECLCSVFCVVCCVMLLHVGVSGGLSTDTAFFLPRSLYVWNRSTPTAENEKKANHANAINQFHRFTPYNTCARVGHGSGREEERDESVGHFPLHTMPSCPLPHPM